MADYLIWKNSLAGLVLLEAQSISSSFFFLLSSFFFKRQTAIRRTSFCFKRLHAISTKLGQKDHWPKLHQGSSQFGVKGHVGVTRGHFIQKWPIFLKPYFSYRLNALWTKLAHKHRLKQCLMALLRFNISSLKIQNGGFHTAKAIRRTVSVSSFCFKTLHAISTKLGQKDHWPKLHQGSSQFGVKGQVGVTRGHFMIFLKIL